MRRTARFCAVLAAACATGVIAAHFFCSSSTVRQAIIDSLTGGAKFADLARSSEDEATKNRGGDLDFFSATRLPADFWAAVKSMRPCDGPQLIQTRPGFHVLEVTDMTDIRVARNMSFDEARPEIVLALQKQKRSLALTALIEDLSQGGIDGRGR